MVDIGLINATGWTLLQNGNMIGAAFAMYDAALAGWTITVLFFTFQLISFIKTKNGLLTWIIGMIFAGLYFASGQLLGATAIFQPLAMQILFITLAVEMTVIMFGWLANR